MTSQDGSKAEAGTIWIGSIMCWGWRDGVLKKQLAAAHFGSKIRPDIKVLAEKRNPPLEPA
jgi:hypothetical protein